MNPINSKLIVIGIINLVVGSFLRLAPNENLKNIYELVPSYVKKVMNLRGDENTDWRLAVPELPYNFGRFRYNFSSFILFTKLSLIKIAVDKDALKYICPLNIPLFLLSFIGLYLLTRALYFWRTLTQLSKAINKTFNDTSYSRIVLEF